MLPIRQCIDPLHINRAAKAVLTEVCELVENGSQGCCNAQNAHFVKRLAGSERSITRALTELVRLGLVAIHGQGKARRILPTPKLRAYYTAPDAPARRVAAVALNLNKSSVNLDINGQQPSQNGAVDESTNLDKSGSEPSQKRSVNLAKSGRQHSQKWSPTIGDEQDEQKTSKELSAELARAQKKISELERLFTELKNEVAVLKNQTTAAHTGGGAAAEPLLDDTPTAEPLRVVPPAAEDDPWFARPESIEMIDEFLAKHHQQRVRQHAGKGYLFWAEYEAKAQPDGTWILNNGRPITNWRALILQFGFREPPSSPSHATHQHRQAPGRGAAKATGPQHPPLSEGLSVGPPLTGTLDDL